MVLSRLIPKTKLLTVASRNPRLVRNLTEPVYDASGYASRPFFATINEYWMYAGSACFAAFMYFVMSSPLSEITPAGHQIHTNEYSDKWNFVYPELEKYVRANYDKLKNEKAPPRAVLKELIEKTKQQ